MPNSDGDCMTPTPDEVKALYSQVSDELCDGREWCWAGVGEPLQRFAQLLREHQARRIEALSEQFAAYREAVGAGASGNYDQAALDELQFVTSQRDDYRKKWDAWQITAETWKDAHTKQKWELRGVENERDQLRAELAFLRTTRRPVERSEAYPKCWCGKNPGETDEQAARLASAKAELDVANATIAQLKEEKRTHWAYGNSELRTYDGKR